MSYFLEEVISSILAGIVLLAAFLFFILWGAFAFATLWGWFVVPATGFGPIGYWHAAGLTLTVSFIRLKLTTHEPQGKKVEPIQIIGQAIAIPFVALALGWIIKTLAGL